MSDLSRNMFDSFENERMVNKMETVSEVYGGNYLNAQTVRSEKLIGKILTISEVGTQDFTKGNSTQNKLVLSFNEISKKFVANKTNARILAQAFGDIFSTWTGKKLLFQITKRQFQSNLVDALEVIPQ